MTELANNLQHVTQLRLESERRLAMIVTSIMFVPNVLFVLNDRALIPDQATLHLTYALRASQIALWLGALVLIRQVPSRGQLRSTLFGLALALNAFILAICWLRPPTDWMPVRTLFVLSFGTFVAFPYRIRNQLISWCSLAAGTLALLWWHYPTMTGIDRLSVIGNFTLAGVLGLVVARNRSRLDAELDDALVRERAATEARERSMAALRTLEGIIPICSYCHEVRTEAGAWQQLDDYVHSRTDAQFSHGICPRCATMKFPDIMDALATAKNA